MHLVLVTPAVVLCLCWKNISFPQCIHLRAFSRRIKYSKSKQTTVTVQRNVLKTTEEWEMENVMHSYRGNYQKLEVLVIRQWTGECSFPFFILEIQFHEDSLSARWSYCDFIASEEQVVLVYSQSLFQWWCSALKSCCGSSAGQGSALSSAKSPFLRKMG